MAKQQQIFFCVSFVGLTDDESHAGLIDDEGSNIASDIVTVMVLLCCCRTINDTISIFRERVCARSLL